MAGAFACLLVLCFLPSCEKPPVESIIRAEKTLQEARDIKADRYAPIPYKKADKALAEAKNFVKARRYKDAAGSAELATRYARQSIDLVPTAKEEFKSRSAAMLAEMGEKLLELKQLPGKARNKRTKKKMENLLGPFVERWGLQMGSLKAKIEKEEPYEAYNTVEAAGKDFEKDLKDLEAKLRGKKVRP